MRTVSGSAGCRSGACVSGTCSSRGAIRRILERAALVAQVPQVAVARVEVARGLEHRDAVSFGVGERVLARADVPLAPRRDHRELRRQRQVGQLEAHLVVALAGAAVSQRVGAQALARTTPDATRSAAAPARCRAGSGPRRPRRRAAPGSRSRARTACAGPRPRRRRRPARAPALRGRPARRPGRRPSSSRPLRSRSARLQPAAR